jgi:drug/metabolite transporter (DMT)-like permease
VTFIRSTSKSYLFAVIAVLIWGTTFALSKFILPPLNPITFTAIRSVIGITVLLLFLIVTHQVHQWIVVFKKRFFNLLWVGIIFYAGSYLLQYWGIMYTTATNQAMLSNTQTFWLVFFNFIILKKKPSKRFILGAILAFIGVLFIILNEEFQISPETIKGDLISIVTFIFWGLYSFCVKPLSEQEKPLFVTTSIIMSGLILLVPLSLGLGAINEIGLTFICWATALSNKEIPSENIVLITMLNPVIGVITSVLWLDELLTPSKVLGIFIVLLAVVVVNYSRTKKNKTGDNIVSIR